MLGQDVQGGFVKGDANTTGYTKPGFSKPHGQALNITVNFADVGIFPGSTVAVYDVWASTPHITNVATLLFLFHVCANNVI